MSTSLVILNQIYDRAINYHPIRASFRESTLDPATLPSPCFRSHEKMTEGFLKYVYNVSPNHGRSCVSFHDGTFYSLKGTGWNLSSSSIHTSPKDPRLVFGLLGCAEAQREYAVSLELRSIGVKHGEVVAYCLIEDRRLHGYRFKDGTRVHPSILYTKVACPLRIKDLAWIDRSLRCDLICSLFSANESIALVFQQFVEQLFGSVFALHDVGGVNDSLHYDNVTVASEIVDLEWLYYPSIPLPDGSTDIILLDRQRKELLYALEICQVLSRMIGSNSDFSSIFHMIENQLYVGRASRLQHLQYLYDLCRGHSNE